MLPRTCSFPVGRKIGSFRSPGPNRFSVSAAIALRQLILKSEDAAGAGFFEESERDESLTRDAAQLFRENRRNFR
jgi:hypothetical protein